ncbi:HUA1 [Symbiodinium necroappetens]|uniref:HUA1 protein n=1 Tax=Symbiodinium necroappetens TaxID=1628268 RepID=A0A813AI65_9DINO|nr:HUA1 [Symbiodinium necroappetens]
MSFGPLPGRFSNVRSEPYAGGALSSGAETGEVCQFFVKTGWCKWGDGCRHAHIPGPDTPKGGRPGGPPDPSEACKFFAKAGWCQFGDSCRYQHLAGPQTGGKGEVQHGLGPKDPSEACQFFAKAGWCKYGAACRYAHALSPDMQPQLQPQPTAKSGEVCQFFAKSGWCKYGDHCRHEHLGMGGPPVPGVPDHIGAGSGDARRFHANAGWHPNGDTTYQHPPGAMGYGGCGPGFGPGYGSFGPPSEAQFLPKELSAAEAEAAAAELIKSPGMLKAESIGLQLSDEAVKALLTIPSSHASQLLVMLPKLDLHGARGLHQEPSKASGNEAVISLPRLRLLRQVGQDKDTGTAGTLLHSPGRRGHASPSPLDSDEARSPSPQRAVHDEEPPSYMPQHDAQQRVRHHMRQKRRKAKEEEHMRILEEKERADRVQKTLPHVEAYRHELARKAAELHRREKAEKEMAALEQEQLTSARRERVNRYIKPEVIQENFLKSENGSTPTQSLEVHKRGRGMVRPGREKARSPSPVRAVHGEEEPPNYMAQQDAQQRVRHHMRQKKRKAKEEEEIRILEEKERMERVQKTLPHVEAYRRELARKAAELHRREKAEKEMVALEQEQLASARRERVNRYMTPDVIQDHLLKSVSGTTPTQPPPAESLPAQPTQSSEAHEPKRPVGSSIRRAPREDRSEDNSDATAARSRQNVMLSPRRQDARSRIAGKRSAAGSDAKKRAAGDAGDAAADESKKDVQNAQPEAGDAEAFAGPPTATLATVPQQQTPQAEATDDSERKEATETNPEAATQPAAESAETGEVVAEGAAAAAPAAEEAQGEAAATGEAGKGMETEGSGVTQAAADSPTESGESPATADAPGPSVEQPATQDPAQEEQKAEATDREQKEATETNPEAATQPAAESAETGEVVAEGAAAPAAEEAQGEAAATGEAGKGMDTEGSGVTQAAADSPTESGEKAATADAPEPSTQDPAQEQQKAEEAKQPAAETGELEGAAGADKAAEGGAAAAAAAVEGAEGTGVKSEAEAAQKPAPEATG